MLEQKMRVLCSMIVVSSLLLLTINSTQVFATKAKTRDISHLITKEAFLQYKDVADFIDESPQVTINVEPSKADIEEYGPHVKSLTGSDCDRDGKMDDNATCNAVFYKLWLKYAR